MNREFIAVKNLTGELVLSHRNDQLGVTLTTKEIYFQKPHLTYYIPFELIFSIIPYQSEQNRTTIHVTHELKVHNVATHQLYQIKASEIVIINRKGRFIKKGQDIIFPIPPFILKKLNKYSDLVLFT